jgi:putative addiction module killer protein
MLEVQTTEYFDKWLHKLRDVTAANAIKVRIANFRRGLLGDVKPVGDGVLEARLHLSAGYRIYFVKHGNTMILLLCGGDKGSQKADIAKAKKMLLEE